MTDIPTVSVDSLPTPLPGSTHVLDVREEEEWQHGHIEGATHIPLADLPTRLDEVPDGRTLVVCRVGGRSLRATAYLQQQGRDAVNLDGGMLMWEEAGRPMVSEQGGAPGVI